jgi:hypothetical protein
MTVLDDATRDRDELYRTLRDALIEAILANPDLGEPVELPMGDEGPLSCVLKVAFGNYEIRIVVYAPNGGSLKKAAYGGLEFRRNGKWLGHGGWHIGDGHTPRAPSDWPTAPCAVLSPSGLPLVISKFEDGELPQPTKA